MRSSAIVVASSLFLASCVSNGQHEAVVRERDTLQARVSDLEGQVKRLESERARLLRKLDEKQKNAQAADGAAFKAKVAKYRKEMGLEPGQKISAKLVTTAGSITCELWPDVAPRTVANFVGLSEGTIEWTDPRTGDKRKDPLYNGTIFHRVIPNFMVQGGDPMGTGRGGPGYRFEDEVQRDVKFDQPGLLAMANSGPATNGSQFFITDSTPNHLNMKHSIFGKCGDMDVVKAIITAPVKDRRSNRPVDPPEIQRIEITRG